MALTWAPTTVEHRSLLGEAVAQGHVEEVEAYRPTGHAWTVTVEGSILQVRHPSVAQPKPGLPTRGTIGPFTPAARRRCLRALGAYDWRSHSRTLFITLTWHPESAPTSGPEAAALVKAFRKRWERRYGRTRGAWKREFTRNGTVHYHLWLDGPDPRRVPLVEVRRFCADAWNTLNGNRAIGRADAGTTVEEALSHPAKYAAGYATAKGSKEYQHQVPDGFTNPGRWWGTWGWSRNPETVVVSHDQAVKLRRTMARYRRARVRAHYHRRGLRGRTPRQPTRYQSAWLLLDLHHPEVVARQLLTAAGCLDPPNLPRILP